MKNKNKIFVILMLIIISFMFLFFYINREQKTHKNKKNSSISKKKLENIKKDTILRHTIINKKGKNAVEIIPKRESSLLPKKYYKRVPSKSKKLDSNVKILQIKQDKKDSIEALDTVRLKSKKETEYIDLSKIKRDYINKLTNYIDEKKQYPKISKKLKQEGIVFVKFTIEKRGKITNVLISKKSNFKLLDKQAYETINQIKDFKKIPKELNLDSINIEVPIEFKILKK